MMEIKDSIQKTAPPGLPRESLPTMYDLPSESPEDSGVPDEFHILQPELLRLTFQPATYPPEECFCAIDLNLYYDVEHHFWYKRPDWFGVVGVSRLYEEQDLRLSYVIWQERVSPTIIVELLSPGTEDEDLGRSVRGTGKPPTKWEVYEQILRVPYYVVFDRYTNRLRGYILGAEGYEELDLRQWFDNPHQTGFEDLQQPPRIWMPELELGLGLWLGTYQGIHRLWLRWYNSQGEWILTPSERELIVQEQLQTERQRAEAESQRAEAESQRAEAERQRAEAERQRAESTQQQLEAEHQRVERLEALLREQGIDPNG